MKKFNIYNDKIWGHAISPYAKQTGYLDYHTLSKLVGDMILNNYVFNNTEFDEWELVSGCDFYAYDKDGNEVEPWSDDEYDREYIDVYQFYIITDRGADVLKEYTTELVYYSEKLDMYLWGITHFGTSWDYVLTGLKLADMGAGIY